MKDAEYYIAKLGMTRHIEGGAYKENYRAPGFDFADFKLDDRTALLELFPQHRQLITEMTFDRNPQASPA